jgi:hypothetical protein
MNPSDDLTRIECWHCGTGFRAGALGGAVSDREGIDLCPCCGMRYPIKRRDHSKFLEIVTEPSEMPQFQLTADDVRHRLPPVETIGNTDLRERVIQFLTRSPAYFWQAPLCECEDPPPSLTEAHGIWKHTLLATYIFISIADSWRDQNRLTTEEFDLGLAALLLHDQRLMGSHGELRQEGLADHALRMSEVVNEVESLPNALAGPIASHMGADGVGPAPATTLEELVHIADLLGTEPLSAWIATIEKLGTLVDSNQTEFRQH